MIKRNLRRMAALFVAFGCLISMSSCWDAAEINGRAFVLGFGIDSCENGGYDFTFQLAVPVSGGDSSDSIEYVNCTITDNSAASAIRTLEKNTGRLINFEQLTAIIIGEELSHGKFTQITEMFFRRASVRRQSCIAVCTGSAMDFFNSTTTGRVISSDAATALQSYDDGRADSMEMNLHSLYTVISNREEFYLLKISAVNPDMHKKDSDEAENNSDAETEKYILEISGANAYGCSGEYLGEINSRELEILRLISNSQTDGVVSAAGTDDGSTIYYRVKESRCGRSCSASGDSLSFNINLNVKCALVDSYGVEEWDIISDNFIDVAQQDIVDSLTNEITALSAKSRSSLGSSVMGLQDEARQKVPDWYDKNSERWNELYSNAEIAVVVNCEIIEGGLSQ